MTWADIAKQRDGQWQRHLQIPSMRPTFSTASAAGSRSRRRPKRPHRSTSSATSSPTAMPACRPRVERIAGRDGCGDHLVVRSAWGQDAPGILVLSHHRHRASAWLHRAAAVQDRRRPRVRPRHLRHEGRRLSRLPCISSDLRAWRTAAARHHPALRLRRGDRQPDLARADRGRGAQGQIRAGDGARARRRQDRHRAQGRRPLRSVREGRARACRHAAAGRPQRHPRARAMSSRRWRR